MIPSRWQENIQGASLTSIKLGGPIKYFSKPTSLEELQDDIHQARVLSLPWRVIGGGSNLIMADEGFKGLIIRPAFTQLHLLDQEESKKYESFIQDLAKQRVAPRYAQGEEEGVLQLASTEEEEVGAVQLVEMGAGVPWGQAVMWSLNQGLSGLHWYARIPCQVGGAAFNNIHGEKHFVSEVVVAVHALTTEGEEVVFGPQDLQFGYDMSRFHSRQEVITKVIFGLQHKKEGAQEQKALYLTWTAEKSRVQPSGANCGSVFQNLTPEQHQHTGQTAVAAAWYIDQAGLRGLQVGEMQVYEGHANFILNKGKGTQADFIALLAQIREAVHSRFDIWLEPEAECIDEYGVRKTW